MADYLQCQDPQKLRKFFLVHGEYETQLKYQAYLESRGFINMEIPSMGMSFTV
jgi:metallo-beta-lactamase family protein